MENTLVWPQNHYSEEIGKGNVFLQANTSEIDLEEIRNRHIIPVFLKDNEPAISQVEFVEAVTEAAKDAYSIGALSSPAVRVSHPVKGRIYEARHKKANELLPTERTIYYERLAWMVTIPTIMEDINGQLLELTVGGVKAYNLDNMNANKGSFEHFKIFVGFKNTVCTNLCISTDGTKLDLKVKSLQELYAKSYELFTGYDAVNHVSRMTELPELDLSESQFAKLIGRARMYQYLPKEEKLQIPELLINDTQISRVAESYYSDENFSRYESGRIDLWRLYNLMTGAAKSSYIDKFLEREVNAFDFTLQIKNALEDPSNGFWYLN